jgi:hypothetical protein
MLNMGPAAVGDEIDPVLTNAGKVPGTELPGASYFHHADSFAMMRGGPPRRTAARAQPALIRPGPFGGSSELTSMESSGMTGYVAGSCSGVNAVGP